MNDNITHKIVRDCHDWGEFFVRETSYTSGRGEPRYAATFTCWSSFGVYGYHWSHMGEPFAAFIKDLGPDYFLGKIAGMVFDDAKFARWLKREIFTSNASKEQKLAAARAFRDIQASNSGEGIAALAYNDADISRVMAEWSDCDSRSYDPQAVAFSERIWPKFVTEMQAVAIAKLEGREA